MMILKSVTIGALLFAAAAAGAQTTIENSANGESAEAASSNDVNNDPDQVVCVSERRIGSRVARNRVCRTRAEWAEVRAQARLTTDRVQSYKPNDIGMGASPVCIRC